MFNIMNNNFNRGPQKPGPIIIKNNMPSQVPQPQQRPNMPPQVLVKPHLKNPLMTIKNKNLAFISTQPDNTYFHWQVEVYMHQFSRFGIADNCYILFAYSGDEPSEGAKNLKKMYKNVHLYKDEREDKSYLPTVRPHLLAKFFKEYPYLAKNFFYHDADIIFTKLPNFSLMLNDNVSYLSDTIGYIGYKYIMDCCKRYKDKYPELADNDLFIGMCKAINIDPKLVIANQDNSGGAQLLLKNTNWQFWDECEKSCNKLYKYLCEYEQKYPISHHIQKWTAEMWAILWDYWKMGGVTKIHKELDFSWATDTISDYNSKNIFHLAGVTGETSKDRFYKGLYTNKDVIDEYIKDNTIFDHVIPTSATYGYTRIIIECAKQRSIRIDDSNTKQCLTLELHGNDTTSTKVSESTDINTDRDRRFPFGHFGHKLFQKNDIPIKQIEEPIKQIEEPIKQIEEPIKQIEDGDLNELNKTNFIRLDYFKRRQMAFALLDNIPLKDMMNDNVEPKHISEHKMPEKKIPEHKIPEKDIFSKFIYIKRDNTPPMNQNNLEKEKAKNKTNITAMKCLTEKPELAAKSSPPFQGGLTLPLHGIKETLKYSITIIIEGLHYCANTYIMDDRVTCCGNNIWRSIDKKLIIFFNGSIWIITYASCENDIGPKAGGIVSNLSTDLFVNKWNFECTTKVIKDVL